MARPCPIVPAGGTRIASAPGGSRACAGGTAPVPAPHRKTGPDRTRRSPARQPPARQSPAPHRRPGPATEPPEADGLLARLRCGDEDASLILVERYRGRMLATARRMVRDDDLAADCVQDAFLNAFRMIHGFEGRADLGTWLHRITVNAALMKLRARRRRPEQSIEDLMPEVGDDGIGGNDALIDHGAEVLIERAGVQAAVRAAIARLPENLRTILILRDIEGLNTEEAAATLAISVGAAKTRLHRARLALKVLLEPTFGNDRGSALAT